MLEVLVRAFTPQKLANIADQSFAFFPGEPTVKTSANAGALCHLSLAKSLSHFLEAWLPVHTCMPHPLGGLISGNNTGSGRNTVDTRWLTFHGGKAEGITVQ